MFRVGNEYTREYIHRRIGGSVQAYMPTVSGAVVAACLTMKMNPRAPKVILCGKGPIIAKSGATLSKQREPVPVFIKRAVNRWEYQGKFKVVASHSSGPRFKALVDGSGRNPSDISLAIELSEH